MSLALSWSQQRLRDMFQKLEFVKQRGRQSLSGLPTKSAKLDCCFGPTTGHRMPDPAVSLKNLAGFSKKRARQGIMKVKLVK